MTKRPSVVLAMTDQQRYDFLAGSGFALDTMPCLDALADRGLLFERAYTPMPIRSAAHHYGRHPGNFAADHLAGPPDRLAFVEWDQASTPGIDDAGYRVEEGVVHIPDAPGFGLDLDDSPFAAAVQDRGFVAC